MVFPDSNGIVMPPPPQGYNSYRDGSLYGTYPRKAISNGAPSNIKDGVATIGHRLSVTNGEPTYVNGNTLRGILRNKPETFGNGNIYHHAAPEDCCLDTSNDTYGSQNDLAVFAGTRPSPAAPEDSSKIVKCVHSCAIFSDVYLRPAMAEFMSVLICTFCITFVHCALIKMQILRLFEIAIVALMEGAVFSVVFDTFRDFRIHISPAITLAAMFSGSCPPLLGVLFWFMQLIASVLGVLCYQLVVVDLQFSAPDVPTGKDSWLTTIYKLVLCQTFSSVLLVLCYLMDHREPPPGVPFHYSKPRGIGSAVVVASFISLLCSTGSWNPIRSLAVSVVASLMGNEVNAWNYHYVFWLGPLIGSLIASFFYRLLFAADDKRLICCRSQRDDTNSLV